MHATIRFRQQLADDRVEVFDTCEQHAAAVRRLLSERHPSVEPLEMTAPNDAVCPYDGAHGPLRLIPSAVEDGHLMGTS